MNVKIAWMRLQNDDIFNRFFPEGCKKKSPPREYFWKVYSVVRRDEYETMVVNSRTGMLVSGIRPITCIRSVKTRWRKCAGTAKRASGPYTISRTCAVHIQLGRESIRAITTPCWPGQRGANLWRSTFKRPTRHSKLMMVAFVKMAIAAMFWNQRQSWWETIFRIR